MALYQKIPSLFKTLFPQMTWSVQTDKREIFLTFDDGPHPQITPWVLEQLKAYNMKATFFCVGDNVARYPETYKQVLEAGHRAGNHTFHHIKGWVHSDESYLDDIAECASVVNSKLFRPPYGRIKLSQAKKLSSNYRIIMWSLLSGDFDQTLNRPRALQQLYTHTKPGSIVVFHDSLKAQKNLKRMLPKYLQFLNENGFTCSLL